MSQKINLNAYFERIGFAGSIAPSAVTLELIHALHPATIPIANLNPLLGRPVDLGMAAIIKQLLTDRRGGNCFEHNLLLMAVLRELDYSVKALAARVLWNDPTAINSPKHHMLLSVDIGGNTYISDVGFGGMTLTTPLKLRADTEQQTPHETFRLTGGQPEWQLEVLIGEDWKPLYAFDLTEQVAENFSEPNAFISTSPDSAFTRELQVSLSPSGRRVALHNNRLVTHIVGEKPETRLLTSVAEMREVLTSNFGIALPSAEFLDPKLEVILANAGAREV